MGGTDHKTKKKTRKPEVISVLPWEEMPPGYDDLRPFLQRDGLILLSWAMWHNHPMYGRCYRVNWIRSRKAHRRYRSYFFYEVDPITDFKELMPAQRDNRDGYYLEGYDADIKFQTTPENLDARTIPHFVERLKKAGVTVDFDLEFSFKESRELEIKKIADEEEARKKYKEIDSC